MPWILIVRIVFTLVSLACGAGGLVNATQAASNAMSGSEVTNGDGFAVFAPLIASAVSALVAWFAPGWLPNGISGKESSEAAAAIVGWAIDPKNPKKIRTAGLECLDVLFELIDPSDAELQKLLKEVSAKFHEKYGRLPANNPVSALAEPILVTGRKSR